MITGVAALGPPSESCTGACATVTQYLWNGTGTLDNYATQDAAGNYTDAHVRRQRHGHADHATADPDSTPSNGNGSRTEWRFYGDTNFPGKVTEIRRKSDLSTVGRIVFQPATRTGACARSSPTTRQTADGGGRVATRTEIGYIGLNDRRHSR